MKTLTIVKCLSVLTIFLSPLAFATYYFDTDDIQQLVISEAKRQNIAPSLALAIAKVESDFNPKAISHAGARGVMQIMPRTAEQVFGVPRSRLFEPDVNIELGVKFIKRLLERYDDRLDIALSHYNGGSGVKNRHGELSVMPATRDYVDKILDTQQGFLNHDSSLQHDNRALLTSRFNQPSINQSGISYMYTHTGKIQTNSKMLDTHSQHPQIETLRALRLHNITRNYKDNRLLSFSSKPVDIEKTSSVQTTIEEKIAKVRQWESIYR
ncbi:MAG: hypothetical protein ACI9J4_001256 [Paraglaciecola sp.]|jgi:hypothetical protein